MYLYINIHDVQASRLHTITYFCAKLRIFSEPAKKKATFLCLGMIFFTICAFFREKFVYLKKTLYLCSPKLSSTNNEKVKMKKGIHPENYRPVVFRDMSNGDMFLTKSTAKTNDTVEFEGETYPVVKVEISSTSHPFYTGKSKLVDTAGRVDKFMSRYGKAAKK